jgi:tetratricopeptide (TPR) repeat protein
MGCRVTGSRLWKKTVCAISWLCVPALLVACAGQARAETIPGLGTAVFPTSTHSAEAQKDFLHGLLLLHLFEYEDAAKWFVAAEKADPGFAMAYWGEAMTFNHPVWNEVDVAAGRAALAKFGPTPQAREGRIANARERSFMAAVEILYSDAGSKRERDASYAAAMERLSEKYPKDDEAQLFYALALLGKSEGVRDVPTYLKAAAIARAVFYRNPNHPGAAHYWIHGMDDPQHAAGALVAARALSRIAPDAAHAQHMCSHIFVALGLWDDVVRANVAATSVVNRQAAAVGKPPRRCGHYSYWLEYGYLEQGRAKAAKEVMAGCREQAMGAGMAARARGTVDPDDASVGSFVVMRARYLVDTGRWQSEVTGWKVDLGGARFPEYNEAYGTGFAAAERGDLTVAAAALARMDALQPELKAVLEHEGTPESDPEWKTPELQRTELKAAMLEAEGHGAQAVELMEDAAAMVSKLPYAFGPPTPGKPVDELLGELLLKQHRPAEARSAFETALKRAPRRTQSLLGLARAESAMGDRAAAAATYGELLRIWKNADADYAGKAEAQRFADRAKL